MKIGVIKKDGTREEYNPEKIKKAVAKSAERVLVKFSEEDYAKLIHRIEDEIQDLGIEEIPIAKMHILVEAALEDVEPKVAESYKNYRNYKTDFVSMLDEVYRKAQSIMYIGDKENSNTDSALVATKRSLIYNQLNKELYKKFFLTTEERQACKDGYIYIHDMSARRDTMNCCLFDMASVLKGGFEMGNLWYNEPNTLSVAFDVIGDVILSVASQQYGGFTVPEIDKILSPYAIKSYNKYYDALKTYTEELNVEVPLDEIDRRAYNRVKRDFEQGFQGLEYKLNSVGSSRGDYPFITITLGLAKDRFGKLAAITALNVHKGGQGKAENKKPVLFPKIVFLYDKELHGEGKELHDVFLAGVECSAKTMYPDWLSLSGDSYVAEAYKKYGVVISPMGCRAFLSLWFERGGMKPADKDDKPIVVGRFNLGAISLHLPMILAKARSESKDFYEVLDYYLEMIRNLHKRTIDYLGEMKASTNPVAYCEGGFYGGHLKHNDKIKPILKSCTISFGITALNELQELYNQKSLVEDGEFALEVMRYINKRVNQFKEEDNILYAIYGTPAESLCFTGDTIVQTYSGNKAIKDIKENDLVYSFNESEHKVELKRVLASRKTIRDAELVEVAFNTGEKIRCTPNHKFAVHVDNIEWTEAKDLKKGDKIKSKYSEKQDQVVISVSLTNREDVYDIEVEDNHNFFVGDNEGILVHNCGLQVEQFRKKFGIIEDVSDKPYVSNSFHCHVKADITPIEKQDLEKRFWNLFNGGKIQYVKYPIAYNTEAIVTLIERAMDMGFYEGVNLSLSYCDDCGHQELEMDVCPKCGSSNLTKIERMNGYLSYSRVHGDTRLNAAKMSEIADRKSM